MFFLHGAQPVPAVNEAHYLGKTIHFWNPDWGARDFFLNSDDTHLVFYGGFGWLSLWLSPLALAWVGRLATWWLLAWAWRRLNAAVLVRPWWSVATAAVMLWLVDHCAMAGEWIVGGAEAKGFAYVLVLLGLEAMTRERWNRVWLCLGGASMIHVLVGGWAAVAAGLAWLLSGRDHRPTLRSMWPGLVGGFLLSLPSLVPSVLLTWQVDPRIVDQANQIQVFQRLKHHLNPADFRIHLVIQFAVLVVLWLAVRRRTPHNHPVWRIHGFVAGAVFISLTGFVLAQLTVDRPDWAGALLRFYWFRLADLAVPFGVALGAPAVVELARFTRPVVSRAVVFGLVLLAGWQLGSDVVDQTARHNLLGLREPGVCRSNDWRDACRWIADSDTIPKDAIFLTPWMRRSFKWYTAHAEVVTSKDVPQDPQSIVEWWHRLCEVRGTGDVRVEPWCESLAEQGESRLLELGRSYGAEYVLTATQPPLDLPIEYVNTSFVVYRLVEPPAPPSLREPTEPRDYSKPSDNEENP
ncbi:MAG: hypothetical protein JW888_07025 [Pirellulales bacterium]|nr:hypothetical protein [Pirellulales bacterium]